MSRNALSGLCALVLCVSLIGCDDASSTDGGDAIDAALLNDAALSDAIPSDAILPDAGPVIELDDRAECEALEPRFCMLPWPTDRWLLPDPSTETGHRIEYPLESTPVNASGLSLDARLINGLDGFSPSSQLLTIFSSPPAVDDLWGPAHVEQSITDDFPTVVMDLETGERIPHWIENDARADSPEETLFFIRPATRLEPDRRYGVAIRGLLDESGEAFEPTLAFRALRDDLLTDSAVLEGRREGFESLFEVLETHGVERASLQQAWWFHTESFQSSHHTMRVMRDDAIERLGEDGLGCEILAREEDFRGRATKLTGTFSVPWYMTSPTQPSTISRDENGDPVFVEIRQVPFTAIIPDSVLEREEPATLLVWGHGLFGQAEGTISSRKVIDAADEFGAVAVATDWAGMSSNDLNFLALALTDVSLFPHLGEMLQQGMINQIALTRNMMGRCGDEPAFSSNGRKLFDPDVRYFIGGSQGSILGATFLALSPDIHRGALVVGGSGFSFMIERSIHFNRFELLLRPSYPQRVDSGLVMAFSQHVWDRAESASYLRYLSAGLPGISPKEYLYLVAENDAQVPNLSSERAARLGEMPVMDQSVHLPWGVPVVSSPWLGSAYISMDVGDRVVDPRNVSPQVDDDGHDVVAFTDEGRSMIGHFLRTGEVVVPCDGVCDLTEGE